MNWQRIGPHVIEGEHGYRISRSMVGTEVLYRVSHQGLFIGAPVADLGEAMAQAVQHRQEAV